MLELKMNTAMPIRALVPSEGGVTTAMVHGIAIRGELNISVGGTIAPTQVFLKTIRWHLYAISKA